MKISVQYVCLICIPPVRCQNSAFATNAPRFLERAKARTLSQRDKTKIRLLVCIVKP